MQEKCFVLDHTLEILGIVGFNTSSASCPLALQRYRPPQKLEIVEKLLRKYDETPLKRLCHETDNTRYLFLKLGSPVYYLLTVELMSYVVHPPTNLFKFTPLSHSKHSSQKLMEAENIFFLRIATLQIISVVFGERLTTQINRYEVS